MNIEWINGRKRKKRLELPQNPKNGDQNQDGQDR
jgi:hypothetical protein